MYGTIQYNFFPKKKVVQKINYVKTNINIVLSTALLCMFCLKSI